MNYPVLFSFFGGVVVGGGAERFVDHDCDLEVDVLLYGEPLKLLDDRGHVVT